MRTTGIRHPVCFETIANNAILSNMTASFILSLIILAVSAGSLYFLIQAEGGYKEIPRLLKRSGLEISIPTLPTLPKSTRSNQSIPPEFQSGTSRFSQGSCATASDCMPAGCSGEVCGNSPDVVTTCEYSDSFPNTQGYSCTCLLTKVCGWK